MNKRHIIDELVFDISFDSTTLAREQESELGAFMQNRLLPLADEICSELSSDGMVSRIDLLEIDLGDISYGGFRDEMESRFKEKFRIALLDKIQSLMTTHTPLEGMVSQPHAEREQLQYFLETGRMPWNANHETREASDKLLERAIHDGGRGFVEFLKNTPKRDIVVKRLVKQFSDQHLMAVMQLLAPAHANLFENLMGEFVKSWKRNIDGISENDLKSFIWERLINHVLKSGQNVSNPEQLFGEATRTLFLQYAKSNKGEKDRQSDRVTHQPSGATEGKNGGGVFDMRDQDDFSQSTSDARLLMARLESALVEGNAGVVSEAWDEIRLNHAGLVREVYARRMGDERARDKLLEGFPEAMLHDLIRILIPMESRFLEALANELGTSKFGAPMWKHTLGYLHAATRYQRSEYVRSLIAYLSGQGMTRAEILPAITRTDPVLGEEFSRQMYQDSPAQGSGQEEISRQNAATAPRSEALYQRLVRRLSNARREGEMAQEIEELASCYPETLERLCRQLQSGEIRADVAGLAAHEARQLTQFLTGLNQSTRESDFSQAILAHARKAQDEQRYYQLVLEKLIRSQIVDLEAAALGNETLKHNDDIRHDLAPVSPQTALETRPIPRQSTHEPDIPEDTETALDYAELLRTRLEEALVLGRMAGVAGVWDDLCLNHADMIRDTFIRRMGDESAWDKLASGFPKAMLYDLIRILAPMESDFITNLAKQPELYTGEAGTTSEVNVALWKFTLAYLHAVELNGYERLAYVSGLIRHLAGQGVPSAVVQQAIVRANPALEKPLAGLDRGNAPVQETGQGASVHATSEARRTGELYQQLVLRLSGQELRESMQELIELAGADPETLKHLYRQLQAGEVDVDITVLTAREARQHIEAFILLSHGSMGSDFYRAIEDHARKARNAQRYYQNILEKLIYNQIVDLESAMGEAAHKTSAKTATGETALAETELLRTRLESALAQGNAGELSGIWEDLRFNHAELVRKTYSLSMGNPNRRKKLVQGFPQAMLFDLIRLLTPQESLFIETLAKQPELQAGSTGNIDNAILRALWEHTLAYLHALGADSLERMEYAYGLMRCLAERGMEQAALLQAITRIDPPLGKDLSGQPYPDRLARETGQEGIVRTNAAMTGTTRAEELYQRLAQRLNNGREDIAQEIEELAGAYPETLARLYRQLQTDAIPANFAVLSAREARLLTTALVSLNQGREETDFKRAIEAHARKAQSEPRYYLHILEKLIHNQVIDLEAAMGEAEHETSAKTGTEEAALAESELYRTRLESALVQGNAGELSGIWDDLRLNHAELVRETYSRRMGDPSLRRKLAQGFPEAMLRDLIWSLTPQESSFIEALAKQPELQAGSTGNDKNAILRALWEHTLAYLHGLGTLSFSRTEYVRGLVPRLMEQGMARVVLLQAISRIDTALGNAWSEFVPQTGTGEAALAESELYRTRLESALAQGSAGELSGIWDDLRLNHAGLVRETYRRRMGNPSRRRKLAQDFPEAMLRDLIRLLTPQESGFIEALAKQPELQAGSTGNNKNAIRQALWEHALAYLHGLGTLSFSRTEYVRGLVPRLMEQGMERATLLQAISRIDAALGNAKSEFAPKTGAEEATLVESDRYRTRLESALVQGSAGELSGIWDDLRLNHAGLVRETYRRRMGDASLRKKLAQDFPEAMLRDLIRLLTPQESGFIEALAKQPELQAGSTGNNKNAIRQALWEHALAYLHGLGTHSFSRAEYVRGLMSSQAEQGMVQVTLLQAVSRIDAALGNAIKTPERQAERAGEQIADLAATQVEATQGIPAKTGTGETAQIDAELYRTRLESALAQGHAGELNGIWDDLRLNHAGLVREVYDRLMGGASLRRRLAQGFPGAMLRDLTRLLAPQESSFIEALARQPELQAGSTENSKNIIRQAFWEHTLAYLHEDGARSFNRTDYVRGLISCMAEQGMEHATLQQAITRIDQALGKDLFGQVHQDSPVRESRQEDIVRANSATIQRAEALYQSLARRLSSERHEEEMVQEIEELASSHPETLARLYRQLQVGEIRANFAGLSKREAIQLTNALVALIQGERTTDFKREIEAHARKAPSEKHYYQRVLEKLIHNQIVDLDDVKNEVLQDAVPAERELLRTRLENALVQGNAGEISGVWGDLYFNHAELVRETYNRRMGDPGLRMKLVQGFPEVMLLDLIRLLAPQESSFIEALVMQPELRPESTGNVKNAILRALWEHTLAYLYRAGTHGFRRTEYTYSLIPCMVAPGMDPAMLLQAITRIDPALGNELSWQLQQGTLVRKTGQEDIVRANSATIGHADALYQSLARRLSSERHEGEVAQEIEELASSHPETLARLYRQLQAGEIPANLAGLSAREARQLTLSFISLNQSEEGSDFRRAIEAHARKARSEQRYYQHILENLIYNQIVDLEAATDDVLQDAPRETIVPTSAQAEEKAQIPAVISSNDGISHRQVRDNQPPAMAKPKPDATKVSTLDASRRDDMVESAEEIYIANAGMVLLSPYLPQLFRMLGLTDGAKFRDERAIERAIHLLQYTVNESSDSPEFLLALNKIMCGFVTGVPIVRGIELLPAEKEAIEGMLAAIIQRWTIIGKTSVRGLRESFLQRSGRLQLKGDSWHLKVEEKGIDVLLDRIPWSFAIIKHPWMTRPIYVEWRK